MSLIGIPSLPKLSGKGILNTVLGSGQSYLWQLLSGTVTWGIYKAGSSTELAVEVDTVTNITVNEESQISDYRIQTGSFVSYNKVALPREVPISFCKTGSMDEINKFIEWLQKAVRTAGDDYIYDILTPEKSFTSMALVRYSIERKRENSENILFVDCWFKEVRQAPEEYVNDLGVANTIGSIDADAKDTSLLKQVQAKASEVSSGIKNVFDTAKTAVVDTVSDVADAISDSVTEAWKNISSNIRGQINNINGSGQ